MDFWEIECFVRIAELGSLTRAASSVGISQSALSRQVQLLEATLKARLFYRTGRGVRLTPAGSVFLDHASAIIEAVKRARGAVAEVASGSAGRISIGVPPRIARVLTVPLIEAFRRSFPNSSVNVLEALSATLAEWLMLGRIEIALLFNPPADVHLDCEPLCREELVLVGSRFHVRSLPKVIRFIELSDYPLILPPRPNAVRTIVESGARQAAATLDVVIEVDTVQAILDLVLRKQGYSVLPEGAVTQNSNCSGFQTARLSAPRISHTVVLATSCKHPGTRLGSEMSQLIRDLNLPRLLAGRPVRAKRVSNIG